MRRCAFADESGDRSDPLEFQPLSRARFRDTLAVLRVSLLGISAMGPSRTRLGAAGRKRALARATAKRDLVPRGPQRAFNMRFPSVGPHPGAAWRAFQALNGHDPPPNPPEQGPEVGIGRRWRQEFASPAKRCPRTRPRSRTTGESRPKAPHAHKPGYCNDLGQNTP